MSETVFFRLLDVEDKGTTLQDSVVSLLSQSAPNSFLFKSNSLKRIPKSPFAYWPSEKTLRAFSKFNCLEREKIDARQGGIPGEDFRNLRLQIEVPLDSNYCPYSKGGGFSRFYADIYLCVKWDQNRSTFHAFTGLSNRPSLQPASCDYYFRPGLTWSRRSQKGLSIRVIPQDCIFSDKGPSIFIQDNNVDDLLSLLAIVNSSVFTLLVELQMAFGSYEVGVLQRTPIPDLNNKFRASLVTSAYSIWSLKRTLDTITQTSHAFTLPALLQTEGKTLTDRSQSWITRVTSAEQQISDIQAEVDDVAFNLYDISPKEINSSQQSTSPDADIEEDEDITELADLSSLTHSLIEYALGVALGRFDIQLATGEREHPPEPAPFDPLPICSPGMLVTDNNLLPTSFEELPQNYPINIPFDGILVDDESQPNDIIRCIRSVFDIAFSEQAGDIEQEASQLLKASSLRGYIAKPSAFFIQHLSRYSKSRRQAPIYWPLSTASGSYTLWIYYHRLTDQTLYTCINNYLEPKLTQTSRTITTLLAKPTRTSDDDTQLETLQTLEQELTELRDDLLRAAQLPYKPDLNDGVQLTAAPLWKCFRLKKWQTKLKDTWEKLEQGEYDWAHLAYSIWPDRVKEKCKQDKSLAIAHNLENLYEPPPEKAKKKRKKKT